MRKIYFEVNNFNLIPVEAFGISYYCVGVDQKLCYMRRLVEQVESDGVGNNLK